MSAKCVEAVQRSPVGGMSSQDERKARLVRSHKLEAAKRTSRVKASFYWLQTTTGELEHVNHPDRLKAPEHTDSSCSQLQRLKVTICPLGPTFGTRRGMCTTFHR
jgi:hypothetical protein